MIIDDRNLKLICSHLIEMSALAGGGELGGHYDARRAKYKRLSGYVHSLIPFIMKGCDWNEDVREYGIEPNILRAFGISSRVMMDRAVRGHFASEHEHKIWKCELEIEELKARVENLYAASQEEVLREVGPKTVERARQKLLEKQSELVELRKEKLEREELQKPELQELRKNR